MADPIKPAASPAAKPVESQPVQTMAVLLMRDYWPHTIPDHQPEGEEYRVRAGETVDLPVDEAFDVVEKGIGTRPGRTV